MISPFFAGLEERINEINMIGTRQTGVKQRLRNKHRQSVIMEICTIVISLCQILSFHYLFPGAKDTFLDFIEKKILFLVELNVKMFKILFLVELNRKCFLVQLYAKLLKKRFFNRIKNDLHRFRNGSQRVRKGRPRFINIIYLVRNVICPIRNIIHMHQASFLMPRYMAVHRD